MTDKFYSYREVANLLGVHIITVQRWCAQGRLKVTRLGPKIVRISQADLNIFLQNHSPPGQRHP